MFSERVLIEAALAVMRRAYAPYSRLKVGAALATRDGHISTGCNVENASYGLTICAERTAVARAVAEGSRRFAFLAVASTGRRPVVPCGACLQVLSEFGTDLRILLIHKSRIWKRVTISELLPEPFHHRKK